MERRGIMVYTLKLLHRHTEKQRIETRCNGSFGSSRWKCYFTGLNVVLTLEEGRALTTSYHTVRYYNIAIVRVTVVIAPRVIIS